MDQTTGSLVSITTSTRYARGVVYVGLAFIAHGLIWGAIPAPFALAFSCVLILVERLAGELADIIIGAVLAADKEVSSLLQTTRGTTFQDELKLELYGPIVSIGLALTAAVIGISLKPWLILGFQWLGT